MILYLDSSALLKLYVAEADSNVVHQWARSADILASCRIALVEAMSGLARRQRDGTLNAVEVEQVRLAFLADWDGYVALDMNEVAAAALVQRHALRALDAIHLAAALRLASAPELASTSADGTVRFASFDQRQRAAAAAEGLAVLPPDALGAATSA
jgi:predicted nucleic acid-binding protein